MGHFWQVASEVQDTDGIDIDIDGDDDNDDGAGEREEAGRRHTRATLLLDDQRRPTGQANLF